MNFIDRGWNNSHLSSFFRPFLVDFLPILTKISIPIYDSSLYKKLFFFPIIMA